MVDSAYLGTRHSPKRKSGRDAVLRSCCIAIALILGLIDGWLNRFYVSFDGVSYLDMADAYLRRDWNTAVNGFWNPLYSWSIAIAFALFHPTAFWQYPVVQLVNYIIYAGTLAAFEYFLQGVLQNRSDASSIRVIAYGVFIWTSLGMIRVWMVNPDMCVALTIYLAVGIMQRPEGKWSPLLLGVALATGYYAKSVMLPIGCLILLSGWRVFPRRGLMKATAVFLLLCSPWIFAISRATGHLSIGETGRLNYAWWVDGVEDRNWRGGPLRAGTPIHPSKVVLDQPRVYAFGGVFPVTYPMWYDVSYWFRGLHVWPAPRRFLQNFFSNAAVVAKVMILQGLGFLIGWILCFRHKREPGHLRPIWYAWNAAAGAILLYCAVHCETRYLGALFAIVFLAPFIALKIQDMRRAVLTTVLGLCCAAAFLRVGMGEKLDPWQTTPVNLAWQEASGLQKLGVQSGDNVGLAGGGEGMRDSRWARLAKVHMVAELDRHLDFWSLDGSQQNAVLCALAASGAKEAVIDTAPRDRIQTPGWKNEGGFFLHVLARTNTCNSGSGN